MVYVLYGALGILAVLGLLALGAWIGWRGHIAWQEHTHKCARQEATEEERRSLLADQRAFENMLSYNTDMAYGLVPDLDELARGEAE
jgi:predicted negative regulator of RcsB-dependent stress response